MVLLQMLCSLVISGQQSSVSVYWRMQSCSYMNYFFNEKGVWKMHSFVSCKIHFLVFILNKTK